MTGFSWERNFSKTLEHKKYRLARLSAINPDYRMKHVAEAKLADKDPTCKKCSIEAEKRIEMELARLKKLQPPTVKRPERLNRSV